MGNYYAGGELHENVAGVTLLDGDGNRVLMRPVGDTSVEGIAEFNTDVFTVTAATKGGASGTSGAIPQPHGLTGAPDGWSIMPETWTGDLDQALSVASWHRASASFCGLGRRDVAGATTHLIGTVEGTAVYADEEYIYPSAPAYAMFQPGVTYRWIAWRLEATA